MKKTSEEFCDYRVIHQPRIDLARERELAADKVERLAQFYKAIADPGRIKILLALEHEEMCVCDLAAYLGVSESAVSHQLRVLRQSQLVANRREGAVLYYRLNNKTASCLLKFGMKYLES
jgi:DNA-binding transcriptional ArsR family regulator